MGYLLVNGAQNEFDVHLVRYQIICERKSWEIFLWALKKMKTKTTMKSNVSDSNDTLKMSNRNTLAFWIIVWLISVLTVGNLLLTLTIFGVLRLGKGMEFLEVKFIWNQKLWIHLEPTQSITEWLNAISFFFDEQLVPEAGAVKLFGSVDLDKIYKKDGVIEGFYDMPVIITGTIALRLFISICAGNLF